mmetsp:Transcript_57800/g.174761  ORF Transcript_57800/g.174761 Transcript_57800/m.174761 type:complete len:169 (+) Transcript_57800:76-582(+)
MAAQAKVLPAALVALSLLVLLRGPGAFVSGGVPQASTRHLRAGGLTAHRALPADVEPVAAEEGCWWAALLAAPAALAAAAAGRRAPAAGLPARAARLTAGAAALGLAVGLPAVTKAEEKAKEEPKKEAVKPKPVPTKAERLAKQRAQIQAEMDRVNLTKEDGTIKNGQ